MLVTRALNNLTHKVKEESTPNPKMKKPSPYKEDEDMRRLGYYWLWRLAFSFQFRCREIQGVPEKTLFCVQRPITQV